MKDGRKIAYAKKHINEKPDIFEDIKKQQPDSTYQATASEDNITQPEANFNTPGNNSSGNSGSFGQDNEVLEEISDFESNPAMLSLKSGRYDVEEGQMQRDLVSSGVFSQEEADLFIDRLNKLFDAIEPKRSFLDLNEEDTKESRVIKSKDL